MDTAEGRPGPDAATHPTGPNDPTIPWELGRVVGRGPAHDPLAAVRRPDDPPFDVFLSGTVFLDIIFTGLAGPPTSGTEIYTDGMGCSPGGVANLAIALSRLGLRTSLAAAFGHDVYGAFCRRTLEQQEDVDLTASREFPHWHSPVTVSLAYQADRSLITHAHEPPLSADEMIATSGLPRSRACFVDLAPEMEDWTRKAAAEGTRVFADTGWDPTEQWSQELLERLSSCYAFMPNTPEALAYTRTDTPEAALAKLGDLVPVAVVTRGSKGALAVDNETGEHADVPALPVEAMDATGAGDVFAAGFVTSTLAGWPLLHRLRFANLCAALSVQHFGGSLSAPGWADIAGWWQVAKRVPGLGDVAKDYAFLDEVVPHDPVGAVRRASATIGFQTDGVEP
ncbi:carbohydrate kinase family protein [Actinopolymorpha singaporensis]|uniref:Sugar or nucleoside kinase, ribokinase family n=1 Tax=Actinopolymorpha singaporensis TaxID=117157 RepID=A0A1H1WD72_9ACTN|nr:carbohydrate kinase family protein [Actinopolymorpha singaporensis]SDS94942.1 Sugar or nucleoside kinase, ribokinase family [Actinopolymorpha singaporensis]